ncbi:MAG: hypothetical protein GXP55_15370 [Deltaproteobacteria bacterium]|nr:hypothetical protein [Deltaproteobacteria bacterium]
MAKMSIRRKLAIATWASPREGNIYGKIELDVEEVMRFLDSVREKTGEKATLTHFVGRVLGEVLAAEPGLNGRIAFGRFVPHDTVDLSFLVALDGGKNLAKVKVSGVTDKKVSEIAAALRERALMLRTGKDSEFEKSKPALRALPTWILRPLVWFTGWLAGALGMRIPALGVTPFPFGSAIVTSLGMLGVDEAYVPPTPFARVPLYVMIGAIRERAVVRDGRIVPRKMVTLTVTLDHRFIDGFQAGTLAKLMRELFADPWSLEPGLS